jgi:hypothetical protein
LSWAGLLAKAPVRDPRWDIDVLHNYPALADLASPRHIPTCQVKVQRANDVDASLSLEQPELIPHPRIEIYQLVLSVPQVEPPVQVGNARVTDFLAEPFAHFGEAGIAYRIAACR